MRCAIRIGRGRFWIAEVIHYSDARRRTGRRRLECITVAPVVVITEDAEPRARSEHGRIDVCARGREQTIPQCEEECFVFDDWSSDADRIFMEVREWPRDRVTPNSLICPRVGIQCAVLNIPDSCASILVRAGPCQNLNLRVAAANFS